MKTIFSIALVSVVMASLFGCRKEKGIRYRPSGKIYVADANNARIRKLSFE